MAAANDRLLAEVYKRVSSRKIYTEYGEVYDTTRPYGADNIGAYPWQIEFHNAGIDHPERMLMAANRVGKTQCAADPKGS